MKTNKSARSQAHQEFEVLAVPFINRLYRSALILTGSPCLAKRLLRETFWQARNSYRRLSNNHEFGKWIFRILFGAFWSNRHHMDRPQREMFSLN